MRQRDPLGKQRRRWEDKIQMHLQEMGWGSVDWNDLAQDRDRWRALVNAVTKNSGSIKFEKFLD